MVEFFFGAKFSTQNALTGVPACVAVIACRKITRSVRISSVRRVTIRAVPSPFIEGGQACMLRASQTPEELLDRARSGDRDAFGELLKRCHNDIRVLAGKSDRHHAQNAAGSIRLVQETYLEAHRDFPRFTGSTETRAAGVAPQDPRPQRDRQRTASDGRDQEPAPPGVAGNAPRSSPACRCKTRWRPRPRRQAQPRRWARRAVRLAQALAGLPADYREVIVLRNLEGLRFQEVAARMGRSPGAVRMLWARAIERLSEAVEGLS